MSIENRMAAKKRAKQAKAKRIRKKIFTIIGICLIPVIIALIAYKVIDSRIEKNASNDRYLNSDGTIDAKAAKSYVDICDYKNIVVTREDLLPTESQVQASLDSHVNELTEKVTEDGTELGTNSTVFLTYTVSVNGTELESYAADNRSYNLGSGNLFGTEFDDKLQALHVGDSIDFSISFADDYSDTELAGKTAVFAGKVDGVNVTPVLTDELVAESLSAEMGDSEYPKTADGFRQFIANELYEANVEEYVDTWITDNTKVKRYPFFYTRNQYYLFDRNYTNYVDQMNSLYGSQIYNSPAELLGLESNSDYKKYLKDSAKNNAKYYLAYQAIYEDAGLPAVTEDDMRALAEKQGQEYETLVDNYGYNYIAQAALQDKTFDYVMTLIKEEGDASKLWNEDTATDGDASSN